MNDEIWQCAQILMWILGIQTTVLITLLGALHNKLSSKIDETNERIDKTNERIDKLSDKVEDVDRRLCRIEGSLATQGHCLFNQSKPEQKAQ